MTLDPAARREQLYGLLGDLPDRDRAISARTIAVEDCGVYILEKLSLDLNGEELVPAYFVRPSARKGRCPTILYHHAHGGKYEIGKNELTRGRGALENPTYAEELTRRGYAALCIDMWLFGERRGRDEADLFKETLWRGQVLWGKMVYDALRSLDYLVSRDDVDPARVGTMGISMGSTMAWWVAALDERIHTCIDLCCLTDFEALIETRGLAGHGIYYFVPSLLKYFTTAQINALIAPRAHLSLAGEYDSLTPPTGLDRIDAELREAYASANASDAWKLLRYGCGHMETAAMRAEIVKFLDQHLQADR
jgi:dienelactone hydrolase